MKKSALIVIDIQNDYFENGAFPLWEPTAIKNNIVSAISQAKAQGIDVIHVQHIADPAAGPAPFFNEGTQGAEIHPDILAAAPDAPIVVKHFADSFEQTTLKSVLDERNIEKLLICGMMTHNCVTHTAISKAADAYDVTVLTDLSTTVSEVLHLIALHALSVRVTLSAQNEVLG